jgi:hypothetical protein
MNRGRVGEERGGKETDGCPLTVPVTIQSAPVLTQAFPPLGYLSFHHHLLLDLSPSGYL